MPRVMQAPRARAADAEPLEAVNFGPLADWLGFNLRMAQNAAFAAFARLSKEVGEKPGRFATLMLIGKNPGISQTALSRANARDKSSLTPVLSDLVRRRLVSRTRVRHDRRAYRLTLTPTGEKVLQELIACAKLHEANLDAVVGRERTQFLRTLKKIAAELG